MVDRGLKVGNGGQGGDANTVYFTAGLFDESHGLFGSLTTAAAGSPEGAAEAQMIQADLDVVQLSLQTLQADLQAGAPRATIRQDVRDFQQLLTQLVRDQRRFVSDNLTDSGIRHGHKHDQVTFELEALQSVFAELGKLHF